MSAPLKPIGIYYENEKWLLPLFAELKKQNIPFEKLFAPDHLFVPHHRESPYSLVINRMSPSAHKRNAGHTILYTLQYLAYLKSIGANFLNGYETFVLESSKAYQANIFEELDIKYPKTVVVNDIQNLVRASEKLRFPVLTKSNIGGSGAGIQKFHSRDDLQKAVADKSLEVSVDNIILLQEYLTPKGGTIVRVEVLNDEFLYAIKINVQGESFNLCPAEDCGTEGSACTIARSIAAENYLPPLAVIETVKKIFQHTGIEIGGVEYLVNEEDGEIYYYDINTLSNFVTNATDVVGFDPWQNFVEYIVQKAEGGNF
ncbi:MAG: hypothetical protein WCJ84_00120 [Candidatus Peregrinibacteria bacterium]